jgi:hypothetical protein
METAIILTNPEFSFTFMDKEYRIRKANLDKAIQYQQKVKELQDNKDSTSDLKLVAFCIYIVLKDKIPDLTEKEVLENTPADIDVMDCLSILGFINPKKVEMTRKIQENLMNRLTTENSLPSSQVKPDGLQ